MKAKQICETLGGTWYGNYGLAFCPAHDNKHSPALSLGNGSNGMLLANCFSGCSFEAIIAALRARCLLEGTFDKTSDNRTVPPKRENLNRQRKSAYAREIWDASRLVHRTHAANYLASRGITCALPESLRFHPSLYHAPSQERLPALVARIDGGAGFAVHRTFLAPGGVRKADIAPAKMMLGPARAGAVCLGKPKGFVMVGEGIETCLSVAQATGAPALAALSTSGLRALALPSYVHHVLILADGDDPGEAAACDCQRRWTREGLEVRIARPPSGMDFNDLLLRGDSLLEGLSNV